MKNEQIRKWALGAEITSAIAVVMTIGFLAFQMMENTNALQAQMFQELMRDTNEWRARVSGPEAVEMRYKWTTEGFESLTRNEQLQVRMNDLVLWGIYESAYFANERGILGGNEWTRFESAICRNRERQAEFWNFEGTTSFSELLTTQFVEYIENTCH